MKEILMGYNNHTIYQVYFKDWRKVIQVKNLCIFQYYKSKFSIELSDYSENIFTF